MNGLLRTLQCLLLWLGAGLASAAAPPLPPTWSSTAYPPRLEHLSRSEGLSQGTVMAIHQDRQGFLWVGTEDGLNRYDGVRFKVYRHDPKRPDSLSSGSTTSIQEDALGRLWVGTATGLQFLDRQTDTFQHFKADGKPGSPASDGIAALALDSQGNLWIGTDGVGLDLLPAGKGAGGFQHFTSEQGLPGLTVVALLPDAGGRLWIAMEDGGLATIQSQGGRWVTRAIQSRSGTALMKHPLALALDHAGRIWVGGAEGLQVLDPAAGHVQDWTPRQGAPYIVRRLFTDSEGVIWVGTDGQGLGKVIPPRQISDPPVMQHFRRDALQPFSLSSDAIEAIAEDRTGCLWIGTYLHGLNKLVFNAHRPQMRESPVVQYFRPGAPASSGRGADCMVSAFLETRDGELWIGMDGGGLDRAWPPAPGKPLTFERIRSGQTPGGLEGNVVTCLREDRKGRIWAGTFTRGLARIERNGQAQPTIRHYKEEVGFGSPFILCLWEDARGHLFTGHVDAGLHRFDPETGRALRIPLGKNPDGRPDPETVFALQPDAHGTLWIGTNDGLYRLDIATGKVQPIPTQDAPGLLSHPNVRSLHLDRAGTLWVGTQSGGLNAAKLPPPGQLPVFRSLGAERGLPEGPILCILEDKDGHLWLSGPQGVAHFNPIRNEGRRVVPPGGLQSGEYGRNAALLLRSGEMLLGGVGGFILFDPEDLSPSTQPARVVITDLRLYHQSVSPGQKVDGRIVISKPITELEEVVLRHKDRIVSFSFAALHFTAPQRNEYAVLLEGFDPGWTSLGPQNHVTYTALPPGTYLLRVKAANGDGIWSGQESRLRLVILAPFWRTAWFYGLLTLVGAACARSYIWLRLRAHQLRERILEDLVAARTAELASANAALEELATTDAKTGILNYRGFETRLKAFWPHACRRGENHAVILIDIDHFKAYNDHLGHQAGDECLRRVAQTLQGVVRRAGDMVARYGGEEFILLLQDTDLAGAGLMSERVRQAVMDAGLEHPASQTAPVVTVSVGCCVGAMGRDATFDAFLMRADQALYRAKARGRNQSCLDTD